MASWSVAATAALVLGVSTCVAGETIVRTNPVGVVSLRLPGSQTRALSIPLKASPVYTGSVTSFAANTITTAGASWQADEFGPFGENPCYVSVTSGPAAGHYFKVVSNTANTVTIDAPADFAYSIAAGNTYEICYADTLEELFGPSADDLVTDADPAKADNLVIREGTVWNTYYNDGEKWLKQGDSTTVQNAKTILPDEGVLFVRKSRKPVNLSITGDVPVNKLVTELPANATVFLANPFPADVRLEDTGFQKDPSWITALTADDADLVQIYSANKWKTYFHDGKRWRLSTGRAVNPKIDKGTAVLVVRRNGGDVVHTQTPPYTGN